MTSEDKVYYEAFKKEFQKLKHKQKLMLRSKLEKMSPKEREELAIKLGKSFLNNNNRKLSGEKGQNQRLKSSDKKENSVEKKTEQRKVLKSSTVTKDKRIVGKIKTKEEDNINKDNKDKVLFYKGNTMLTEEIKDKSENTDDKIKINAKVEKTDDKAEKTKEIKEEIYDTAEKIEKMDEKIKGVTEKTNEEKVYKNRKQVPNIYLIICFAVTFVFASVYFLNRIQYKLLLNKFVAVSSNEEALRMKQVKDQNEELEEQKDLVFEPNEIPEINLPDDAADLSGKVIVIDPGHQAVADYSEEPIMPETDAVKARCTIGAKNLKYNIKEYEFTLKFSKMLKAYLEKCGATVYLTRENNETTISNMERAQFAVSKNPNLFLRIHADNSNDITESGIKVYIPDSGELVEKNNGLGENLGNMISEALGSKFDGIVQTSLYAGLNYANSINSFQINMGMLSNNTDAEVLCNDCNLINAVKAISLFTKQF